MTPKDHLDKTSRGIMGAVGSCIFYLLIPVLYFAVLPDYLPAEIDVSAVDAVMGKWFIAGIPLIIVSFFQSRYAYGNVRKFYATVIQSFLSIAWMLYITNMGDLSGIVTVSNADLTMVLGVSILGIILIGAAYKMLKLVIAYADYRDNRDDYAEENKSSEPADIRVKGQYD